MSESENAVVVFTARSPNRIVREGGSQAWVLNPARAKRCKWLVCTQNQHNPDHDFSDATEQHSAAFLIGKIAGITPSMEDGSEERWIVEISEYAFIDKPDVWKGWRNPVRYTSLAEIGIDLNGLEFQSIARAAPEPQSEARHEQWPSAMLSIPEAKKALAATFGVKPEAVEITIRG